MAFAVGVIRGVSNAHGLGSGARSPQTFSVERPTKFDLTINLKTATALGLQIPKAMLFRADHVIE